jgi:predicted transcriptional regulator
MAINVDPDDLVAMCFRRVPDDVVGRDVVLAALWHLLVEHAQRGLPIEGRTIRHTHLGQRAGIHKTDFRAALIALEHDGLIGRANNGYCLTRRGFAAVRELLDVDRTIELARQPSERHSGIGQPGSLHRLARVFS